MMKILRFLCPDQVPKLLFCFLDNAVCYIGVGFVEGMLEPHLRTSDARATQMEVALPFLFMGCFYMATTPVAGVVCLPHTVEQR